MWFVNPCKKREIVPHAPLVRPPHADAELATTLDRGKKMDDRAVRVGGPDRAKKKRTSPSQIPGSDVRSFAGVICARTCTHPGYEDECY